MRHVVPGIEEVPISRRDRWGGAHKHPKLPDCTWKRCRPKSGALPRIGQSRYTQRPPRR